jgi:rod shape determining protein RodA
MAVAIDSLRRRYGDPKFHVDWVMAAAVGVLATFGCLNVFAARRQWLIDRGANEFFYVRKQVVSITVGLIVAVIVCAIDYRRWREYALVLYVGTTAMLAVVPFFGVSAGGARAWFNVAGYEIQPSEFAKVTAVLAIAAYASLGRGSLSLREFIVATGIIGLPSALTMLQPDLGTTLVFGTILMAALLVAGARLKHIVAVTILGVVATVLVLSTNTLKDYQQNRLTAFIDAGAKPVKKPTTAAEKNLQAVRNNILQSQTAIGSGGLHGKGYLSGPQTNGKFVPQQHTDFIFSAVGEQFGFVGSALLLLLYGLIAWRIWRTAQLSRDLMGTLVCAGALGWMVFQVFENVGMTMGIMPVTGIPLPLMSYGGSSTLAFLVMLGLVENVHMRRYL